MLNIRESGEEERKGAKAQRRKKETGIPLRLCGLAPLRSIPPPPAVWPIHGPFFVAASGIAFFVSEEKAKGLFGVARSR